MENGENPTMKAYLQGKKSDELTPETSNGITNVVTTVIYLYIWTRWAMVWKILLRLHPGGHLCKKSNGQNGTPCARCGEIKPRQWRWWDAEARSLRRNQDREIWSQTGGGEALGVTCGLFLNWFGLMGAALFFLKHRNKDRGLENEWFDVKMWFIVADCRLVIHSKHPNAVKIRQTFLISLTLFKMRERNLLSIGRIISLITELVKFR